GRWRPAGSRWGLGDERPGERRRGEVRLQLDRGEAGSAVRQRRDAPVAASGVGKPDDRSGMQVAVRREQLRPQRQVHPDVPFLDLVDLDAEQPRQPAAPGLHERPDVDRHYLPGTDEMYVATALICASVSLPLKAGITEPPLITWCWTRANGGLS